MWFLVVLAILEGVCIGIDLRDKQFTLLTADLFLFSLCVIGAWLCRRKSFNF